MPPQDDQGTLAGPALAVGAFAAGAAVALLAKRLVDARRSANGGGSDEAGGGADGSSEDLATVLRRAALDVAVLASGQAAERLQSDRAAASSG
jgi:hypothetical protein